MKKSKETVKFRYVRTNRLYYHLMLLPAVILVFMFNTRTWPGLLIAFENFIPTKGWFQSPWVGLKNFKIFFMQPDCWRIIRNTLVISIGKLTLVELTAIAAALMINEVRNVKVKRLIQTAVYLPHFVSWVIFAVILKSIMGTDGLFNNILSGLGMEKFMFLGTPSIFPGLMILTEVLKEFGFNTIVYLAAITGIDQGLYEAAKIDGATRWQQTVHVTIPGISYIIVLTSVLNLGSILNGGFDQIFNMYNTLVMSTGDIIDTWIYRQGLISLNYGVGTAVGLFKNVISLFLMSVAYWAADRFADYKVF